MILSFSALLYSSLWPSEYSTVGVHVVSEHTIIPVISYIVKSILRHCACMQETLRKVPLAELIADKGSSGDVQELQEQRPAGDGAQSRVC